MAKLLSVVLLPILIVVLLAGGCRSGDGQARTLVLYGFSVMEDVMKDEIIPAFQRHWKERTGEEVRAVTSFAGSGSITNLIIFGAPAQVAMVATELDALSIKKAGMVTTPWRNFKNEGTYAYSVVSIVTRQGNPMNIWAFEDLAQQGVEVLYPDPTTSGGAQWSILALYGSVMKATEASASLAGQAEARDLLSRVSLNVGSLPESARRALTQFALGYGDALLTYENEALTEVSKGKNYEIIVPISTIHIEPKVIIVDRNIQETDRLMVEAFVDFLWTDEAQEAFAKNNFRVSSERIMEKYADKYPTVALPFDIEYLGGWEEATATVIDQIWRSIQREIR